MQRLCLCTIVFLAIFAQLAVAQVVTLSPVPKQIFVGTTGSFLDKPLGSGKIYTYASGTSTPAATYNDYNGTSANANPIVLGAAGFANIWLTPGS